MLCLQTEAVALRVRAAGLSRDAAIEKIAGIKLQTRLGCRNVERASRGWLGHASCMNQARAGAVQHEVVIVAAAEAQLFVILCDPRTDCRGSSEIERRAGDR